MSKVRGRKKSCLKGVGRWSSKWARVDKNWTRERVRHVSRGDFRRRIKMRREIKKMGELIKTEEGALHKGEYPDFCRFNLLFLRKECISYFPPPKYTQNDVYILGSPPASLNKQLLQGDEMHLSLPPSLCLAFRHMSLPSPEKKKKALFSSLCVAFVLLHPFILYARKKPTPAHSSEQITHINHSLFMFCFFFFFYSSSHPQWRSKA